MQLREQRVDLVRSIKQLIQEIRGSKPREFDAYSILDSNVLELEERIRKLEALNLYYYTTAYRTTDQSIPNNTTTNINFDATDFPQIGNMHDNTANNDKIYCRRDGVYIIAGGIHWEADVNGYRLCVIDHYGPAGFKGSMNVLGNTGNSPQDWQVVNAIRYMSVDDYVVLRAQQTSGGALNVLTSPHLSMVEIRQDLDPSEYGLLNPTELTS